MQLYIRIQTALVVLRNPTSLLAALIFMSIVAQLIALQFFKVSSRFVQREEDAVVPVAVLQQNSPAVGQES